MVEMKNPGIGNDVGGLLQKLVAYCREEDWAG
jgi:hypothetical protein